MRSTTSINGYEVVKPQFDVPYDLWIDFYKLQGISTGAFYNLCSEAPTSHLAVVL